MALKIDKPTLLVFYEKHGNINYLVANIAEYIKVLTTVAKSRLTMGWYETTDGEAQTDMFADTNSQFGKMTTILNLPEDSPAFANGLHHFMRDRTYNGYEYESFELIDFEKIKE